MSIDGAQITPQMTIVAGTYEYFKCALREALRSLERTAVRSVHINLIGEFARDEAGEYPWDAIEEVQMDIRFQRIPDGVWAMLRESTGGLYVDIVRL